VSTTAAGPGLPALILGKHITALGALRVLARHGVDTRCVEATSDMITRSRWYRPAERTLTETSDSAVLASYLEGLELPGAVLIACNDKWTAAVAGLPPGIRARFPASLGSRDLVEQFIDKGRFRALVERLGLAAPTTIPVASVDDLRRASDADLAGGFLKPTDSATHNRSFGTKGFFVTSIDEARRVVEAGQVAGVEFMLQEYIPGGPSHTVIVDGFIDRHGALKGILARRRVRMYPPRLANTCCGVTVALHDVEEAVTNATRLVTEVGWRGIFNVEFKYDPRDGHFKIIEMNPRPFWMVAAVASAGVDLPWMAYHDAQDLPAPPAAGYQVGRYAVYETVDASSIVHALMARRRPDGPVLRSWLLGDHAAFWPSDPLPGLADLASVIAGKAAEMRGRRRLRPI
jgi:predicted ATP-grasp superfamily ATP-dependent carboligase